MVFAKVSLCDLIIPLPVTRAKETQQKCRGILFSLIAEPAHIPDVFNLVNINEQDRFMNRYFLVPRMS